MLQLRANQIKALEDNAYHQLAIEIKSRLDKSYSDVDLPKLEEWVAQARACELGTKENITIYVDSLFRLQKQGIDLQKVRRFMERQDLGVDHKLIALRNVVMATGG